ncbi:MAG: hypothetical protein EOS48_21225 [Mesorhizobium sp.]|nr:MAG: hypothetical protein EOS48_21225 [Mesorhizobium sp.]
MVFQRCPKGGPADVIGNAVRFMLTATGEEADDVIDDGKSAAAKTLGDYLVNPSTVSMIARSPHP